MEQKFEFKKSRVLFGILVFVLFLICSVWLFLEPEIFIRNQWMRIVHIQILGALGIFWFSLLICSYLLILPIKTAIVVTSDFLIDNSRFESLGKIRWTEISKIQRIKKQSIEISFKNLNLKSRKMPILKRILLYMTNWNHKSSIIISSALLNCSIEELEKSIRSAFENYAPAEDSDVPD